MTENGLPLYKKHTIICALGISLYLNLREDFLSEVPEFLRRTRRVR